MPFVIWDFLIRSNASMLQDLTECAALWQIVCSVSKEVVYMLNSFPASSLITPLTYAFYPNENLPFLNTTGQIFVGGAVLSLTLGF